MRIPAPFHLSLDAFLRGPDPNRTLEVDSLFVKPFHMVLDDHEYRPTPEELTKPQSSSRVSDLTFIRTATGLWLLDDLRCPIGCYDGSILSLDRRYHGKGLGRELVIKRCLLEGENPVWWMDESAYSPAGYAAHQSAWRSFR